MNEIEDAPGLRPGQHSAADGRSAVPTFEPIYAIFQGGGAKGITHIGALKALEEERLVPVGIAGTSAGAIVAALMAVGYRADEVFDPVARTSILGDRSPVDWLGRRRWRMFLALRRLAPPSLKVAGAALLALVTALLARPFVAVPEILLGSLLAVLLGAVSVPLVLAVPPFRRGGLFDSTALRDLVNDKLREKLGQHYRSMGREGEPPALVTFADIDPVAVPLCRALKIVASDVQGRRLVLFDQSTPCVVVADAVAASAAIPVAFSPPAVRGWTGTGTELFADGGLLSNLPSWVFTVEKRALERQQQSRHGSPVAVMAFTLITAGRRKASKRPARLSARRGTDVPSYLADVLETSMFGSQALVEQFVADLEVIELATPLTTLGFDCGWEAAIEAHAAGYARAKEELRGRRQRRMLTNRLLAAILADVALLVRRRRGEAGRPMPRLRLCLVDPSGPADRAASEFRVVANANMEEDADDRLPLDPRNAAAPQAFRDRKAVFATIKGASPYDLWMTKYEHALVRADVCSIIAIPVFGRPVAPGTGAPPTQRVLCLDSTDDLRGEFDDPSFMRDLTQASLATSATLIRERVRKDGTDAQAGAV